MQGMKNLLTPEITFLDQECNAKMSECPQCRHTLLNARNRTAESVAELLLNMRTTTGQKYSHNTELEVTVTEPEEVKKKLTRYIQYR